MCRASRQGVFRSWFRVLLPPAANAGWKVYDAKTKGYGSGGLHRSSTELQGIQSAGFT